MRVLTILPSHTLVLYNVTECGRQYEAQSETHDCPPGPENAQKRPAGGSPSFVVCPAIVLHVSFSFCSVGRGRGPQVLRGWEKAMTEKHSLSSQLTQNQQSH